MGSRMEMLSLEGLRVDGRRWNELRQFHCSMSTQKKDGSSFIRHGSTKVECVVTGPREPDQHSRSGGEKASVTVEVEVSPFSTTDRRKRSRSDRRIQEVCVLLENTFADTILTHLYPRSEISIRIQVLEQDGGLLQCAINATTLALIDAGIAMSEYICACTAGSVDANTLLDLNGAEENDLSYLTVATWGESDLIALLQLESKLHMDRFESLLAVAMAGCHQVRRQMNAVVTMTSQRQLKEIPL